MHGLGPLEGTIMQVMWSSDEPRSVRSIHSSLAADRKIAYTTVMTVMDNLFTKGLLRRERQGRAYLYTPAASREDHTAALLGNVLADGGDRTGVLMRFIEQLDDSELDALRDAVSNPERTRPDGTK